MTLFRIEAFDAFVSTLPGTTLVDQWDALVAKGLTRKVRAELGIG